MARVKVAYDEKAIQTLDALEHIRLRTGMYIGRIGDGSHPQDGIYVLLKEVVDEFAGSLYEEKKENNDKPAEVGRKEAAYRGCYGVVTMALAEKGLLG